MWLCFLGMIEKTIHFNYTHQITKRAKRIRCVVITQVSGASRSRRVVSSFALYGVFCVFCLRVFFMFDDYRVTCTPHNVKTQSYAEDGFSSGGGSGMSMSSDLASVFKMRQQQRAFRGREEYTSPTVCTTSLWCLLFCWPVLLHLLSAPRFGGFFLSWFSLYGGLVALPSRKKATL